MTSIFNLFSACASVFSIRGILLLFVSTALGTVVGALPGLNATMGIALLSGLTFTMDTTTAVTVLMGVYVGAIYGGSITAITINVPGTGSAAATAIDGYPLAKKGFAGSTIRITRAASMIGTAVGMLSLMLITPWLTSLALQFTSAEYFLLSLFGILICGNVTSKDMTVKGWISGILGVLIALVGVDSIQGIHRFTFGNPSLGSGINLVPAMIGFFAFPEIAKSLRKKEQKNAIDLEKSKEIDKTIHTWPVLKEHWKIMIRSSLIGVSIGTLPGVGENVAAWLAYGDAKKQSKQPEKYGTGIHEAVIGPEVANNAAIGGALIPMLTLGVPGSPPAAVMLSALMLHGLRPGPRLIVSEPMFIYEISAMLIGATAMLWIVGMILTKPIAKVAFIPSGILTPIIAVLCVIGSYSLNVSYFDVSVLFAFGILGLIFDSLGYSAAAIILGVILGGTLDENFRRMLITNNGSLLPLVSRPIALLFTIAILWFVVMPLISKKFRSRQKEISENTGD